MATPAFLTSTIQPTSELKKEKEKSVLLLNHGSLYFNLTQLALESTTLVSRSIDYSHKQGHPGQFMQTLKLQFPVRVVLYAEESHWTGATVNVKTL